MGLNPVMLFNVENPFKCTIEKRVNRFVVVVTAEGRKLRAYVNNTGRLQEYIVRGTKGFCTSEGNKTDCRLFAISDKGLGALIDTAFQAKAFEASLQKNVLKWLLNYKVVKRNVKVGGSLIDYLLLKGGSKAYLEVKSAVLRGNETYAMYPDCPTERGRRHLMELMELAKSGERAIMLFVAALPEVEAFRPYRKGDPQIAELLKQADRVGVEIRAIGAHYEPGRKAVELYNPDMPVEL